MPNGAKHRPKRASCRSRGRNSRCRRPGPPFRHLRIRSRTRPRRLSGRFGFRGVTRMRLDILDGILFVSLVIIVLAVIERRRANVGSVETAKSRLGKWSRLLENIAKCVVVTFGIIFLVAIVLLLYRRG